MKRRQELAIFGDPEAVQDALDGLTVAAMDAGWPVLDTLARVELERPGPRDAVLFWTPLDVSPRERAWVGLLRAGAELRLFAGIERSTKPTIDEHNALVTAAVRDLVVPAVELSGAFFSLSRPDPQIDDLLPRDVVRLLRRIALDPPPLGSAAVAAWDSLFVGLAVASRGAQGGVTAELVQCWLVEDERWSPDDAFWVAAELERVLQRLHASGG